MLKSAQVVGKQFTAGAVVDSSYGSTRMEEVRFQDVKYLVEFEQIFSKCDKFSDKKVFTTAARCSASSVTRCCNFVFDL